MTGQSHPWHPPGPGRSQGADDCERAIGRLIARKDPNGAVAAFSECLEDLWPAGDLERLTELRSRFRGTALERHPVLLLFDGLWSHAMGRLAEGEEFLRAAARSFIDDGNREDAFRALLFLFVLLTGKQDLPASARVAEEMRLLLDEARPGDKVRFQVALGNQQVDSGKNAEAERIFRSVVDSPCPQDKVFASAHLAALLNLGSLERRRGAYDRSNRFLDQALQLQATQRIRSDSTCATRATSPPPRSPRCAVFPCGRSTGL